jgi:hypothetical protein
LGTKFSILKERKGTLGGSLRNQKAQQLRIIFSKTNLKKKQKGNFDFKKKHKNKREILIFKKKQKQKGNFDLKKTKKTTKENTQTSNLFSQFLLFR